ncbi:MAG TPA: hypothetical protein VEQ63_06785 [Bryobacteraceae bacterium]|nr:hypothetical protein [Bryobacteraceae bacterium]
MVFDVSDEAFRNVTASYAGMLAGKEHRTLPRYIDAGGSLYAEHLQDGWHGPENGFRWMAKQAKVELAAPAGPNSLLRVSGSCPRQQLSRGPLTLTVSVEGRAYPPSVISDADKAFSFTYRLGPEFQDRTSLQVGLEVDRTISAQGDKRALGLTFGRFEIVREVQR